MKARGLAEAPHGKMVASLNHRRKYLQRAVMLGCGACWREAEQREVGIRFGHVEAIVRRSLLMAVWSGQGGHKREGE